MEEPNEPPIVACGGRHSLMVRNRRAFSCGDSSEGQLGHNHYECCSRPLEIAELSGFNVCSVSAGEHHSVFLATDGQVYSCGSNDQGQLGHQDPRVDGCPLPAPVHLSVQISRIAAGGNHTVAITEAGEAWAWGAGGSGQLGQGRLDDEPVPVQLGLEQLQAPVFELSCGAQHTVLVTGNEGSSMAWTCGLAFGLGSTFEMAAPVPILVPICGLARSGENVVAAAGGSWHTLLLCQSGRVFSAGRGGHGQLGHGNFEDLKVPLSIDLLEPGEDVIVKAVAAGDTHSWALLSDGFAYGWGSGGYGRLGSGANHNSSAPEMLNRMQVGITQTWGCGAGSCGRLGRGNDDHALFPKKMLFDNETNQERRGSIFAEEGRPSGAGSRG